MIEKVHLKGNRLPRQRLNENLHGVGVDVDVLSRNVEEGGVGERCGGG